jgi:hypothetical protein
MTDLVSSEIDTDSDPTILVQKKLTQSMAAEVGSESENEFILPEAQSTPKSTIEEESGRQNSVLTEVPTTENVIQPTQPCQPLAHAEKSRKIKQERPALIVPEISDTEDHPALSTSARIRKPTKKYGFTNYLGHKVPI